MDSTKTEKLCKGCDKLLPLDEFHKNGSTRHPNCKTCRSEERHKTKNPRKEGIKYCSGCKGNHPTTEFDSDKAAHDGLQSYYKKQRYISQQKYLSIFDVFIKHLFSDLPLQCQKTLYQQNKEKTDDLTNDFFI